MGAMIKNEIMKNTIVPGFMPTQAIATKLTSAKMIANNLPMISPEAL